MVLPHDSIYALSPWFVHDSIYALSPWFVPMVLPHDSIYALSPWFSPFCHVAGRPEHVDTILAIARIGVTIFAAESASSSQQPNAAAS
jgi:hypothetical protein